MKKIVLEKYVTSQYHYQKRNTITTKCNFKEKIALKDIIDNDYEIILEAEKDYMVKKYLDLNDIQNLIWNIIAQTPYDDPYFIGNEIKQGYEHKNWEFFPEYRDYKEDIKVAPEPFYTFGMKCKAITKPKIKIIQYAIQLNNNYVALSSGKIVYINLQLAPKWDSEIEAREDLEKFLIEQGHEGHKLSQYRESFDVVPVILT